MPSAQRPLFSSCPASQGNVIALESVLDRSPRRGAAIRAGTPAPRPLRLIVRHGADGSCQLMASGRLADVCAELNRLSMA